TRLKGARQRTTPAGRLLSENHPTERKPMTETDDQGKGRNATASFAEGAKRLLKSGWDHDNPDEEAVTRGNALTGLADAISGWTERVQRRQAHRQRLFKTLEEI